MVDAALPLAGFTPVARNVRSFNDKAWATSGHDLDRIVKREGIYYGVEIKNTLPYIPRDEFRIKLAMCRYLGLKPLFVSRMAPKNYSHEIIQDGGILWIGSLVHSSILSATTTWREASGSSYNFRSTAPLASKTALFCVSSKH